MAAGEAWTAAESAAAADRDAAERAADQRLGEALDEAWARYEDDRLAAEEEWHAAEEPAREEQIDRLTDAAADWIRARFAAGIAYEAALTAAAHAWWGSASGAALGFLGNADDGGGTVLRPTRTPGLTPDTADVPPADPSAPVASSEAGDDPPVQTPEALVAGGGGPPGSGFNRVVPGPPPEMPNDDYINGLIDRRALRANAAHAQLQDTPEGRRMRDGIGNAQAATVLAAGVLIITAEEAAWSTIPTGPAVRVVAKGGGWFARHTAKFVVEVAGKAVAEISQAGLKALGRKLKALDLVADPDDLAEVRAAFERLIQSGRTLVDAEQEAAEYAAAVAAKKAEWAAIEAAGGNVPRNAAKEFYESLSKKYVEKLKGITLGPYTGSQSRKNPDFIGSDGLRYDAIGTPRVALGWGYPNGPSRFYESLLEHLDPAKADIAVLDLRGLSLEIRQEILDHIENELTAEQIARIILITP